MKRPRLPTPPGRIGDDLAGNSLGLAHVGPPQRAGLDGVLLAGGEPWPGVGAEEGTPRLGDRPGLAVGRAARR